MENDKQISPWSQRGKVFVSVCLCVCVSVRLYHDHFMSLCDYHPDSPEDHRHLALALVKGALREFLRLGLGERRCKKARHAELQITGWMVRRNCRLWAGWCRSAGCNQNTNIHLTYSIIKAPQLSCHAITMPLLCYCTAALAAARFARRHMMFLHSQRFPC